MTTPTRPIRLDMVSDIACPWCWLGLRRLRKAIEVSGISVDVRLHPYQLDPTIPKEGKEWSSYARDRFPDPEKMRSIRDHLTTLGTEEGIDFGWEQRKTASNTLDAHRLIRWASGQGKGIEMKERLFRATFTEGLDVGNVEVLTDLAEDVGLDRDLVGDLLQSDADIAAVGEEIRAAARAGVNGVPTFVIEGRWGMTGAQDIDVMADALQKISEIVAQQTN
jgi:predicted DsbA family dithiol-disulfide isomerase